VLLLYDVLKPELGMTATALTMQAIDAQRLPHGQPIVIMCPQDAAQPPPKSVSALRHLVPQSLMFPNLSISAVGFSLNTHTMQHS
jgi:hypothetical protein